MSFTNILLTAFSTILLGQKIKNPNHGILSVPGIASYKCVPARIGCFFEIPKYFFIIPTANLKQDKWALICQPILPLFSVPKLQANKSSDWKAACKMMVKLTFGGNDATENENFQSILSLDIFLHFIDRLIKIMSAFTTCWQAFSPRLFLLFKYRKSG